MKENIALKISKAIKNGKYLYIVYNNKEKQTTYFWIAVIDINLKKKLLKCIVYNDKKSEDCLETYIDYNSIISAQLLDFTSYDVPEELINKIETNKEDSSWLQFETFNNNILEYYERCNELDNDPYQKEHCLIEGIDREYLLENKTTTLTKEQTNKILEYIYHYDLKKANSSRCSLIMSVLAISNDDKKYVILYYDLFFNPFVKSLVISEKPRVNQTFLIEGKKHSLYKYIDCDTDTYINNVISNYEAYIWEFTEVIKEHLYPGEIVDQLPELMIMERSLPVNLNETYNIIQEKNEKGELNFPLKAFFDNSDRRGAKRKEPSIVIYDRRVNIDQMRVIYNTMKYPITYVQGPPGTGKTQTILNVILSAFFNNKTTLICSSNNKPVDGIIEKLSFKYRDKEVPFPFIRLGNRDEVLKATKKIIQLYNYENTKDPIDTMINKIKNSNDENNKKLVEYLSIYEQKLELKYRLDNANKFLSYLKDVYQKIYRNTQIEKEKLEKEYNSLPNVTNDDVLNLVISASENKSFSSYIYFESIKYIRKLKQPKYKELIDICLIKDEEEKVTKFNKWTISDDNIKLLENVFPIIMTTNISSSKLGTANHLFDLVIMDEAGQANCATALLPIARASSLLLVGDSNQLKPVVLLEDNVNDQLKSDYLISDNYDYKKYSILELMRLHDNISKDIMLTYHYRCGRKIINFSNQRYYNGKLNLKYLQDDGKLEFIDVKNKNGIKRNSAYEEATAIVNYVVRNNLHDTAIITPFVNQQNLINQKLKEAKIDDVVCGTIHSVQGAEKKNIIISSAISPKTSRRTYDWLKNNSQIINVAVTRAKENLIVVADEEAINCLSTDKKDDLYNLVKYVKEKGVNNPEPNKSYTIQIGNSNGSKNEDMFFETISHYCSTNKTFEAKRNVKLSKLFSDDPEYKESKLEFDLVLYGIEDNELVPYIAFEIDGGEHFGDYAREKCDSAKDKICKSKGIVLRTIDNGFVKSYTNIKQLILLSCGEKIEQLELF